MPSTIKLHINSHTAEWECRPIPQYPHTEELMNWGPLSLAQRLRLPRDITRLHMMTRHHLAFNPPSEPCAACEGAPPHTPAHIISQCNFVVTKHKRNEIIKAVNDHNPEYTKWITEPTQEDIITIFSGEDIPADLCTTLTMAYLRIIQTSPFLFKTQSN